MLTRWTPRALLTIALVAIVVLVGAIGWLGWLLVVQDRALERQRVTERLEHGADSATAAISQAVKVTLDQLAAVAAAADPLRSDAAHMFRQSSDLALLVIDADNLRSSVPLPFYPGENDPTDSSASSFVEAEALELTGRDLSEALANYERLAVARDSSVRAGALVRVGRVARSMRKTDIALAAYDSLGRLGPAAAIGRPADLVAAIERCAVLHEIGRRDELALALSSLERDLLSGRWRLSRGAYFAYLDRIRGWRGQGAPTMSEHVVAEALAHGASQVWSERTRTAVEGWRSVAGTGTPVLIARQGNAALAVTRQYADRVWFRDLSDIGTRQRARVTLAGDAGELWRGGESAEPTAVRRTARDSGLPFSMTVTSDDPAGDAAVFRGRRWLWAGLFTTLGLLLAGGGYIVARSLAKELEVARLQSDFVAAVSHEFRTPVASVRQLSEVLDEGRVPDEERRTRYYGLLRRESERLQRLVEGLLDFRRMESGNAEYKFEVIEPSDLVKNVAEEFASRVAMAGHALSIEVPADLPRVRADREAISRALWNLLDNAAKYSPPGSPIALEAAAADGHIEIRVTDRGPGVPPSEQRRIFDKFVRGESARATGAKGTGLGLSMVSLIMHAHHGAVRVTSDGAAGSTFRLILPSESQT